eukprot:1179059-Amphidinium_carterae.1
MGIWWDFLVGQEHCCRVKYLGCGAEVASAAVNEYPHNAGLLCFTQPKASLYLGGLGQATNICGRQNRWWAFGGLVFALGLVFSAVELVRKRLKPQLAGFPVPGDVWMTAKLCKTEAVRAEPQVKYTKALPHWDYWVGDSVELSLDDVKEVKSLALEDGKALRSEQATLSECSKACLLYTSDAADDTPC